MILRPKCVPAVLIALLVFAGGSVAANPVLPVPTQMPASVTIAELVKTLKIADVIDVMRLEGLSYGTEMESDLFPGQGGSSWTTVVELIYDGPTMQARFQDAFAKQLAGHEKDVPAIQRFFGAELGQRILTLEVEARRSLMDPAVEDAAKARVEAMMAETAPRLAALETFSETNDLIEMNVMGALNSNLAFFQGMAEVGTIDQDMSQQDMLMDVWGQEPDIRAETESWVYPYLALAYGPLTDAELEAYIDFSKTGPGQVLNAALFAAFDTIFNAISRDLGRAAAKQMMGEDI